MGNRECGECGGEITNCQFSMPNAQCPILNAQCSMPNSQFSMPLTYVPDAKFSAAAAHFPVEIAIGKGR
ncbi:hypothetical protein [Nostoc sp.]|uniref:hypothetical protein n=1 Tax=Nostoc sp. TaxID=1180 RepID=UPI002FF6C036